jgi:hypothetical protein
VVCNRLDRFFKIVALIGLIDLGLRHTILYHDKKHDHQTFLTGTPFLASALTVLVVSKSSAVPMVHVEHRTGSVDLPASIHRRIPVKRVIGHINLVVWSDESVNVSWSAFMNGLAFDGYRHGSNRAEDVLRVTESTLREIVERVTRNDEGS